MAAFKPPVAYAEWVRLLSLVKARQNDAEAVEAMKKGTLAWQAGVADRFVKKLMEAVNARLNMATDSFQLEMKKKNLQEGDIARSLIALRRELRFVADAADLPALPEKERAEIRELIAGQAGKIQASLEESARSLRGGGRMLDLIRKNRVDFS